MRKFLYTLLILVTGFFNSARAEEYSPSKVEDVVILGGGIGALTSSIYLQRAGINTLVIEGQTPGGAIAQSPTVHNWPGEIEIDGQTLVEKVKNQALANGANIVSEEVTGVDFTKNTFTITTRSVLDPDVTHSIQSKACIIATGSIPRLLGVPGESGEQGYWTRGVYSCAVCDGALYRDKIVAVIGGGDSAITEANYLSKIAKKVYVVLRSDRFRTVEALRKDELVKKPNVEVLYNTKISEILGDGNRVTHLNLSTSKKLPVDGVFVAIGSTPNSSIFQGQLNMDENGYILVNDSQHTSIPGVFAIGDVVDPIYKQAVIAAGAGAKAAQEVENYLTVNSHQRLLQSPSNPPIVSAKNDTHSPLQEISSKDEFYQVIAQGEMPVVFDFYSPYCGPCRQLLPQVEELATKYQGKIRFYKVNVSQLADLADTYNIYGVPTILVFDQQGKVIHQGTGLDEVNKIFKKLDKIASKSR